MKHLELFSGIGGFRRAFDLLTQDGVMDFHCIGYSEIDDKARKTYRAVYDIADDELDMGDIVAFINDEEKMAVLKAKDYDLITAGFPCQTFSMMGKQAGFEDEDRGQMFFRILDVIDKKNPKYLLLENVKNLLTHDNKRTYARIEIELKKRGYKAYPHIFNTADYGLPQTRSRVLIFATKETLPDRFSEEYTPDNVKKCFWENRYKTSVTIYETTLEILNISAPKKYFLSEKIKPTILADGSKNFRSKSEINLKIARPLTASMHKMHRACQDNYYSKEFIESGGTINPVQTCTKEELAKKEIRRITPQESFMLQGFPSFFADKAQEAGINDGALYKQAGNAVSVNMIYAIMYYLIINKAIK